MEIPEKLLKILVSAKRVTILTGAGISAESGIKTFRDPDGLWAKFKPSELASMNGFLANPNLVWNWYQERRDIINNAKPNSGHYAIAEMEEMFPDFTLITQNVDRLHHIAGSKNIIELHGNIIENYCVRCGKPYLESLDSTKGNAPKCEKCDGLIRPAVVWFGEMLPDKALIYAESAAAKSEIFFTVGTSAEVYPAADLPLVAKNNGAVVIEINPKETPISRYMDYTFRSASGITLPIIIKAVKELRETL